MARRTSERLKRLPFQVKREVGAALFGAGELLATEAQTMITAGAVSGAHHKPSAPGEAPNNDTAVLANNIEVTQPEVLRVEVASRAPYSRHLEYGTSRMAARPFMLPAMHATKREMKKIVAKAVKRALRSPSGRS